MSGPLPGDDGAGVEIEFQCGIERLGWPLVFPAHGRDHPIHLTQRQRRGRQQGGPVGHPDGVAQLSGDGRPRGVAIAAMQVSARQTAGLVLEVTIS